MQQIFNYDWTDSVYSDGSAAFVSNPAPASGEEITIRLQLSEDAPVTNIYLDSIRNGVHQLQDMQKLVLQKPVLQQHDLQNTDLQVTDLQQHDLQNTDLQVTDLQQHDLQNTTLQVTDLQQHDLQNTTLQVTDLQQHDLQNTDLQNADFQHHGWQDTDLQITTLQQQISPRPALALYEVRTRITEPRFQYHFILLTEDKVYHYTQRGVTDHQQNAGYDFVLLTDYHQPAWVKNSVFYQIFPERFANGDPSLDVKDGEFSVNGWPAMHIKDWNTPAAPYDQVHCLDFYGGDLAGIRKKIPYLKELGVTALYLNPIFHAPSCHKYDCIDYETIDPHFGGDEALAELSKALHENGMKLILDISINHTGIDHKWFNRDGQYFPENTGAYHNPDSPERSYYHIRPDNSYRGWNGVDTMPTLDYRSPELRDKVYRASDAILRKWLKPPYCIDGWRFDVADEMMKCDDVQLDMEIWPEIRRSIREENADAYILAESWSDNVKYLQGNIWDASMNYYGFCRIIRCFLGLPDPYYWYHPILSKRSIPMDAETAAELLMDYMGRIPFTMWQNQFNLLDSHDVGRLHQYPVHAGDYRGAVITMFTMIGTPSVYYGDEVNIDGWLGGFEGCRYPMPWKENMTKSEIYTLYHRLAELKKTIPALCDGGFKILYAKGHTLAFARIHPEGSCVTLFSIEEEETTICLPLSLIGGHFNEEKDLLGSMVTGHMDDKGDMELQLPAHSSYLFMAGDCGIRRFSL